MNKEIKEAVQIVKDNALYKVNADAYHKLRYCPYGACKAWQAGNITYLKSYNTLVAFYNEDTNQFYIDGLYSTTTRRHINAFLLEYAGIRSFVPFKKYIGKALINNWNYEVEEIQEEEEEEEEDE